jgi:deoxyribonuclease-4
VIHTQYLLNVASPDETIYSKSIVALSDSLIRADALGAELVVTHIGSHRGSGVETGIARVQEAVARVLQSIGSSALLLLENSAGAGDLVGSRFEDLRRILDGLSEFGDRLGVCLDTAHLWGAGYDVSSPDAVAHTLSEFDSAVGLERLRLVHLNDSRSALGSHSDRHENLGHGQIGINGLAAMVHHQALAEMTVIIETPADGPDDHARDIALLKELRGGV